MSNVVVISGHPELEKSYANSFILNQLDQKLDNLNIRRLDELYPDYNIGVESEQQALLKADVIVLQFPLYWYSVPGLLKKWLDDVLTFNFAFGPEGNKLKGKHLILSITVGGPEDSYEPLGYNHFTIEQFVYPLQQTAYLAGMDYQKPIYTHGMVYIEGVYNKLEDVQAKAAEHSQRLIDAINYSLHSDEVKIKRFVEQWFNQFDLLPEDSSYFTKRLSSDLHLVMPEGEFTGHDGFRDWYATARSAIKPNGDHQVQQLTISAIEEGYQLDLRIKLVAETFADSHFKGQLLDLQVDETWQITLNEYGDITIHDYVVNL
ncbi:NAD(P)H-dependent oxidoreductase [Shewanella sp. 202IG2-18]|uniref:NAD(P)H-dependent oxidoreductase n=1 Tax=Parashewanella hymeniacidonis TaxID=2807618 RepID=UPI001961EBD7|nr:NAD(P)H-dependent oxidoreductase [Parashewanella hymeniacidonis]MBM7074327.1 NAD(P)H-dependent oxidoreductase [Parashewanella hymeniacidonis]